MAAYVIAEVEVRDTERFERYRALAAASIAAHGGRYLARGGRLETLEGDWRPGRIVVIEFPDVERARAWYESEHYRAAREARAGVARMRMIVVEGLA
jgi:uncharacterized protein (DUF1330 family)